MLRVLCVWLYTCIYKLYINYMNIKNDMVSLNKRTVVVLRMQYSDNEVVV